MEPSDSTTTTGGVCQAGLRSYSDLILLCQAPILLRNRNIKSMPYHSKMALSIGRDFRLWTFTVSELLGMIGTLEVDLNAFCIHELPMNLQRQEIEEIA